MTTIRYHKAKIGERALAPETLMLGYGYDPALSEGSVKPPVFLTSTFVFRTAEEGRDFFDYMAGRRAPPRDGPAWASSIRASIIPISKSSRIVWPFTRRPKAGLVFSSGMSAIVTTILAYVTPARSSCTAVRSTAARRFSSTARSRRSTSKASASRMVSTQKSMPRRRRAPCAKGVSR